MQYATTSFPLIFFIFPGFIILVIGLLKVIKRILFLKTAQGASGEILSMEKPHSYGKHDSGWFQSSAVPNIFLKVRFIAHSQNIHTFIANSGSRFLSHHSGNRVSVLYDPRNPRKACINNWITIWWPSIMVSGFGAVLLISGFVVSWLLSSKIL